MLFNFSTALLEPLDLSDSDSTIAGLLPAASLPDGAVPTSDEQPIGIRLDTTRPVEAIKGKVSLARRRKLISGSTPEHMKAWTESAKVEIFRFL